MVMWAQRPTLVFLTVCVEDCKSPEIKLDADKLYFKGIGGPEKKLYEITINFFKEIDTEVRCNHLISVAFDSILCILFCRSRSLL